MGRSRLDTSSSAKGTSLWGSSSLRRAGLRSKQTSLPIEAYLIPINTEGHEGELIPLTGVEFIFGSDPSMTSAPLLDPSVAGIHARLTRQAAGDYLLRDQGSIAGTWINYELVSDEGYLLKHGDIIHIGRQVFRFRLPTPPPPPEVRIHPAKDSSPERGDNQETST
ncbi:MAG TPA: FHA domain-containing protein [Anaerolineae bacterium]|nr:FHA domain-containing protein [Anaerolineae bacterium]